MEAIIFCGIQATGKSTFYMRRFFNTHVRISMDLLKTRNKENIFLHTCFKMQQRFVVDNTNLTKAERSKYIELAKKHKYKITGYFFQSKVEDAITRNSKRMGKEKISIVGIRSAFKKLQLPDYGEGFEELNYVEISGNEFVVNALRQEI